MFRIGTKVTYQLPPKGRSKKKSAKKVGIVVGAVPANMEPRANLDTILFVGWKDYKDLSLTKEIDESSRSVDSYLVMDEKDSKVHWPNTGDVAVYELSDYESEPEEVEEVPEQDENPKMEMGDEIVAIVDDPALIGVLSTLTDEERETVVIDEPE